ncbi:hypothetical protein PVAP13_1NG372600 [Panicum virgatum]|uniref:Uncharacterized protein n=1 Tax=Panicum virgatum TaxID=38727 RepID=A0A8T0X497_PANVG|nr:hypothetical protein PVAP13_1NG372600 [Panicum virgatum]
MVPSFVLAVVLSFSAILVFTHALWLAIDGRRRRLPPGPWTLPVIGSVHAVLACSELAGRTVMDTMRAEGHAGNCVMFLPPGPKWRAIRKLVMAEVMARSQLAAREELRQEKAREELPVDVGHAAFVTAVDLVSRTLLSIDVGSREMRDKVKEGSHLLATPTIADIFPCLGAADLQGARRRLSALLRYAYGIVDEEIERRRRGRDAGEPRKNDMVDLPDMNYDLIRDLITDLFLAGSETVSSTVEWAMAELLQCPKSMEMVKEELKAVIGTKGQVAESDISQLRYLQAVRAMATVEIEGYIIPKGTSIIINIWSLSRKSKMWVEPEKFMPERFIGNDISYWGKDFELIPFSAGRRQCLGLPLAHRMLHLILGSLLYHFDWMLPTDVKDNGIDMSEKPGGIVSMATPLKAIAKKCDQ